MILNFIHQRKRLLTSIVIFICIFILIYINKPSCIFQETENGYILRDFGIGYNKKTIFPLWLVSCWLAVIVYLFVSIYYSEYFTSSSFV